MNEISETTSDELKPTIENLYECLFNPINKFISLAGFTDLLDNGITRFKGVDCRQLNFKYKGKEFKIGLFNYIRGNGNTLAVRNGETDSNFIQYVLDKHIELDINSIHFTHDGGITGTSGKTKNACIEFVKKHAPHLIKQNTINIGDLNIGFEFNDSSFQKFIASFLEYSILRNDFKTDVTSKGFNNFYELVEAYKVHLDTKETITDRFKVLDCRKNWVWIQDIINGFTDEECHYELITRDQKTVCVEIHFETAKKKIYFQKLGALGLVEANWNENHKPGKSIKYFKDFDYDDTNLFDNIDKALLYLNAQIGDRIRKIKTAKHTIQEMEKMFKAYLDKVIPGSASLYFSCMQRISGIGKQLNLIEDKIYEIQEPQLLAAFKNLISNDPTYLEINKISHNAQSSALKKYKEFIAEISITNLKETSNDEPMSLNQILYGPPGTGKTYHTINKALEIIGDADVEKLDWSKRNSVKALFDQKVVEGQIVFTTFHQNMSYEDFIEGIKPKTVDNEVLYDIEKGVFKKLCDKATEKVITSNNFSDAYNLLLNDIDKAPEKKLVLETLVHAKEFTIYKNSKGNVKFHANTEQAYPGVIKKEILEHYLKTGEALDWPSYTKTIAKYLIDVYNYSQSEEIVNKKFVLIIDEINRGNVSKIFGELITLIEESKRSGRSEAITAKLPYSKSEFSVPDNVYILGTMNTADRSVEALDTALRRRFDFIEMMPQYDLFDRNDERYSFNGIFAFDILEILNKRIEVLLGRDHLIGHSFFILDDKEHIEQKVKSAFYKNIIPLLQEYFYGDYNKIGLVLGSGFIKKNVVPKATDLFADSKGFGGEDYINNSFTFEIIDYSNKVNYSTNDSFNAAIDILMNNNSSEDNA